jgi:HEAT repeat protein
VDDELVPQLDDPETRPQAWEQLRARLPGSRDAVIEGLRRGSPVVRRACAGILDHSPHDPLVEQALRAAVEDPDWKVRKAAIHAL